MEQVQKKSTTLHWILFFVWTGICVAMYFSPLANYITAIFPMICYYLAKALDLL